VVCLVVLPRQPIHARRGVFFEFEERLFKQVRADMMEERGEPLLLPFPCDLPYAFQRLFGAGEQLRRNGETEHPGRLSIDDKLELARLHDWQVRRLCALEDATGIDANLTPRIRQAGSIAHQTADFGKLTPCICGGDRMTRRQEDQLDTLAGEKRRAADEDRVGPLAHESGESRVDLAASV